MPASPTTLAANPKHLRLKTAVRKAVKWGGAGITVLLVGVWVESGRATYVHTGATSVRNVLDYGRWRVIVPPKDFQHPDPGWRRDPHRMFQLAWSGFDRKPNGGATEYVVPLWGPALIALLFTAAAWWIDAAYCRVRVGLCPVCGYDRAGLAAGAVCPECGAAAGVTPPPTQAA